MAKITVSGYKIKSTRVVLEAYLKLLEDKRPCCTSIARMLLWDDASIDRNEYTHAQFSMMIHNLVSRMQCAYLKDRPDTPLHNLYQCIGMMTLEDHIQLVKDSIALPSVLCNDRSTANL